MPKGFALTCLGDEVITAEAYTAGNNLQEHELRVVSSGVLSSKYNVACIQMDQYILMVSYQIGYERIRPGS